MGTLEEKQQEESKSSVDGHKKNKRKMKKIKEKEEKPVEEIISEIRDSSDKDSDSEEVDFWMPPVGERWDFDDGGDRWGSDGELELETDEENGAGALFFLCISLL